MKEMFSLHLVIVISINIEIHHLKTMSWTKIQVLLWEQHGTISIFIFGML